MWFNTELILMMSEDHIMAKVALKTVYFKLCVDKCWVAGGSCAKPGSPSISGSVDKWWERWSRIVMQAPHHSIRRSSLQLQAEALNFSVWLHCDPQQWSWALCGDQKDNSDRYKRRKILENVPFGMPVWVDRCCFDAAVKISFKLFHTDTGEKAQCSLKVEGFKAVLRCAGFFLAKH